MVDKMSFDTTSSLWWLHQFQDMSI